MQSREVTSLIQNLLMVRRTVGYSTLYLTMVLQRLRAYRNVLVEETTPDYSLTFNRGWVLTIGTECHSI